MRGCIGEPSAPLPFPPPFTASIIMLPPAACMQVDAWMYWGGADITEVGRCLIADKSDGRRKGRRKTYCSTRADHHTPCTHSYPMQVVTELQRQGPHWDRHQGADHIFTVSSDSGRCQCPQALAQW